MKRKLTVAPAELREGDLLANGSRVLAPPSTPNRGWVYIAVSSPKNGLDVAMRASTDLVEVTREVE